MRRGLIAAMLTLVIAGGGVADAAACERQYHSVYVELSSSRYAGASMGNQLEDWCNTQPFRIRIVG